VDGRNLATILKALGWAELSTERFHNAQRYFDRSLELLEPALADERAQVLGNAAAAALSLGDCSRAERFLRQAIAIRSTDAALLHLLGQALFLQHNSGDAESFHRLAIKHGDRSDIAAAALARSDLALIYQSQNRFQESANLFETAIATIPAGQVRARIMANLGVLDWKRGLKVEAETHLVQALREAEAALGPQHSDVGKILYNYAELLKRTGRKRLAKATERRAAAIGAPLVVEMDATPSTVDWRSLRSR